MTTTFISGGVVSSGLVVSGGNVLAVEAGGTALDTTINSGGMTIVSSGGVDIGAAVGNGGSELVSSGGTISSITLVGGTLELAAGAPAGSGTIEFAIVTSGSTLKIDGTSMPTNVISDFEAAPGDTIDLAGVAFASGGSVTELSGGVLQIEENSQTYDLNFAAFASGGVYVLSADGNSGTDLTIGANWVVVSGGEHISGFSVSSGVGLDVGGTAIATIVSSGGIEYVESGGTDISGTINFASNELVFAGGSITSITVDSGGGLGLMGGALVNGTPTIDAGASLNILSGYTLSDYAVASGVRLQVGGLIGIHGTPLQPPGFEIVSGGAAVGTIISGGAQMHVNSAGTAMGAIVLSGGIDAVFAGGTDSGGTVSSGGIDVVSAGGTLFRASIVGSGPFDPNGGVLAVFGGTASGVVISSGGFEQVNSGGIDFGATVLAGGELVIKHSAGTSAGESISASVTGNGPTDSATEILSGATAFFTTLSNVGKLVVRSGGLAFDAIVNSTTGFGSGSNGGLFVSSGGTAEGTTVNSGGLENVDTGGTDSGAVVFGGGKFNVSSGGTAISPLVSGGGTVTISSGGTIELLGTASLNGVTISSGGILEIGSGYTLSGSIVSGGLILEVASGGAASATTVDSGGSQVVLSGGTASDLAMNGSATISGGTLELLSGASGGGPIGFAGAGGTLKIDGPGSDTVSGGAGPDTVDYTNLATPGLVAIIEGAGGTVNKGGGNGSDSLTGVQNLIDNGTGRTNGDVFEVDSAETVTANSSNFNYLIELSAGVNLAYGTNFTGISEFVSNVGTNTVSFATDPNFAYVFGSTGNDTLTLGSGGGYLFGEGGTNVLTGGANATNLFVGGDGGTDTMNGGTGGASNFYFVDGNDQVNGAGAFNTMVELVTGVTVQLGSSQYQHVQEFVADGGNNVVSVANADTDFTYQYGGTGNDTLTTGSGGGYLIGEGGTNVLNGGGGLNVFVADGGSGVDTMNGGSGSNVYFIDGNSTVHGAGTFNTIVELQQNVSLTLGGAQLGSDVQEVVLNGGTNTADFHTATSAVFLYAGAGTNTLTGGTGNDFLFGSTGTTTFGFQQGWGQDTIMNWVSGTNNQIDLTALAAQGVHQLSDLSQSVVAGSDVITSSHTGTNSITLNGFASTLTASSFHFA